MMSVKRELPLTFILSRVCPNQQPSLQSAGSKVHRFGAMTPLKIITLLRTSRQHKNCVCQLRTRPSSTRRRQRRERCFKAFLLEWMGLTGQVASRGREGGQAATRLASVAGGKRPGVFGSGRSPARTSFLEMATLVFVVAYLLMCVTVTSERTKTQEEEDRGELVDTRTSSLFMLILSSVILVVLTVIIRV
ncbi:hypothetical protein RRG08_018590 [Elysia crispata]|uniref:Uncharacterized protein n=1 Tax=Elysia crispata TaxID=231223 RepID=A0AAE1A6K2_9GAST|nr:hypothetical protein RRG08_018590 [Elysia crispata]